MATDTMTAKDPLNVKDILDEINRIPTVPTMTRVSSTDYHKLDEKQYHVIQKISRAHIESFDYMIDEGLPKGIRHLKPLEMEVEKKRIKVWIMSAEVCNPRVPKECQARTAAVYPSECRMRGSTYKGRLMVKFAMSINNASKEIFEEEVGEIPIMLKSKKCNLRDFSPAQMVKHYEDAEEFGGYFIVNGKERIIRLLTANRRHYPMALVRKSWADSGKLFSEFGIQYRSVRSDEMSVNMVLHYLNNGTTRLRIWWQRMPIYLPIVMVLKALVDRTDLEIYRSMIKGREEDTFYCTCVVNMLRLVQEEGFRNQKQIRQFIGNKMRVKFDYHDWLTDEEVCMELFSEAIAPNLTSNVDKFNLLVEMQRKLFSLAKGECAPENPDNPMFHEVSLSGHIYFTLLLERLQVFLQDSLRMQIKKMIETNAKAGKSSEINGSFIQRCMKQRYSDIARPLNNLIATGNLISKSGLGLMQTAGLSVMAEKINFWRFLSHFRAVHRGSFFQEMKTTTCRKLYPEAWGFLCPVHTPDGSPCGLLNHLSENCVVTNHQESPHWIILTLVELGMEPLDTVPLLEYKDTYTIMLDGKVLGHVPDAIVHQFINQLRLYKATGKNRLPSSLEIGLIPKTTKATQYPGIYLFTTPARMLRPVYNLTAKAVEMIGTFEQPYMEICILAEEANESTTHQELQETSILSVLAAQIPFPDFNQSPRNMYACQMGKQTMGTASHTLKFRSDIKMYAVNNPQSPLVRPTAHDYYHMDDFPMGTNAVVAVISYTGYDMEDALILNKSSVERGFKHGHVMKTSTIDLRELGEGAGSREVVNIFGRTEADEHLDGKIDMDGLPFIGTKLEYDDPIISYIDTSSGRTKVVKYHSTETAYVSDVKLIGNDNGRETKQKVCIKLYIPRVPIIGDKFANRHGQKGVSSFLWPHESMPFTGSGIVPDIIFNPHGFPSRMTIGMMIESMAGKSGSCHGTVHDATPFTFSEDNVASEYHGKMLEKAGYNYFGTERLYSGTDGRELIADIFVGVIYYIRLRHMVSDKYQVRSTGPVDQLTQQPVKGRKRCGGIRFGEMERDSLLAHGTSFLLHDRLFNSSDRSFAWACTKCMSIISTFCMPRESLFDRNLREIWSCRTCGSAANVKKVSLPYVLKYLIAELASVNVKVNFKIK